MKLTKLTRRGTALLISCAFAIPVLAILFFGRGSSDFPPGSPGPEVAITINAGDYGSAIASNLASHGVIKSASTFLKVLSKDPRGNSIAPGSHRIETHLPAVLALSELLDTKRNHGAIAVTEGLTYSDIVKLLKSAGISSSSSTPKPFLANPRNSLEGQLFPATYFFAPGTSSNSALSSMVAKFHDLATSTGLLAGYEQYSPYEVLTVASMAQIEGDPTNFQKVARVIYNRLHMGMPLQLNSTVQYAANLRGQIALSRNATRFNSPFNTYIHVGLPPTPISNPGEAAISAALHPADGNWLYFITVKPHDTRFTNDYQTFQSWVTQYNNNLANGAFK